MEYKRYLVLPGCIRGDPARLKQSFWFILNEETKIEGDKVEIEQSLLSILIKETRIKCDTPLCSVTVAV